MSVSAIVVSKAPHYRLTTIATCRSDGGVGADVADAALARMIDVASAVIARYCRRVFAQETVRETICGGASALRLARRPISTIISITCAGMAVAPEEYETDGAAIYRLAGGARAPWWRGPISIEYVGGYALPDAETPTLPPDLEQAALNEVTAAVAGGGRDPTLTAEEIIGIGRWSYGVAGRSDASPFRHPGTRALVDPYREVAVR